MNKRTLTTDPRIVVGVVAVLLLGAVLADVAATSPRLAKIRNLHFQRGELQNQLGQALGAKFRDVDAARALNASDLASAIAAPEEDPVSYLGRSLDTAGLKRLDLVSVQRRESEYVVSSAFTVRASGTFDEVVDFLRGLEGGDRLTVIDDLTLATIDDGAEIEGRFQLTIHDPRGR